jgi:hypothetical protein
MSNKKGQEEMAGFVAIVVLVSIIGLVMLGIILRNKPAESNSPEVYQLLESTMEVTVNCSLGQETTRIRDLFESCHKGELCSNGDEVCTILKDTLAGTIENGLYRGNQSNVKYILEARFISSSSSSIIILQKGNCSQNSVGALYPLPANLGRIDVKLDLC